MRAEDVFNNALDLIHRPRIDTFYDGKIESIIGADIFSVTRDEALALKINGEPWYWASAEEELVDAGQIPLLAGLYEYVYPSSAIHLWQVRPDTVVANNPQPTRHLERIDTRIAAPYRVVLCDFSPAVAVFVQRVVDPNAWPPEYIEILVKMLAQKVMMELQKRGEADESGGRI